ncbi:hypothetical protein EYF80_000336 [Liparis tanakae]|uniref:Uncharacterized protein n=1 Tax=Liparis tanakae TaxID=230148 RepID=A0A4Z2JIT3_9TELE|nr:hypothetical protein EYF80_000336 [Liparis tanakae]
MCSERSFFKLKLAQLMESRWRVCRAESKQNLQEERDRDTGARASAGLIRIAGAVPFASFGAASELLGGSGALLAAAAHVATFADCLAFTLPLTSSRGGGVPLWRTAGQLGTLVSLEKPLSPACRGPCCVLGRGRGRGSTLGSFFSGSPMSVWSSACDFPFCRWSRTFCAVCLRGRGLLGGGAVFSLAFSFFFFLAARCCCSSCSRSSSFWSAASSSCCRCRRCSSSSICCSSRSRASISRRAFSST